MAAHVSYLVYACTRNNKRSNPLVDKTAATSVSIAACNLSKSRSFAYTCTCQSNDDSHSHTSYDRTTHPDVIRVVHSKPRPTKDDKTRRQSLPVCVRSHVRPACGKPVVKVWRRRRPPRFRLGVRVRVGVRGRRPRSHGAGGCYRHIITVVAAVGACPASVQARGACLDAAAASARPPLLFVRIVALPKSDRAHAIIIYPTTGHKSGL